MKISSVTALTVLLAMAVGASSSAYAAVKGSMKGTDSTYGNAGKSKCPPGTCSKMGTSWAQDVRYCSAANCKK